MLRLLFALVLVLGAAVACGDDDDTATPELIEITVVNASVEEVAVYINGIQSTLDPGDEDAISMIVAEDYAVQITGLESGDILYTDTLSAAEIGELDNRIVVPGGS